MSRSSLYLPGFRNDLTTGPRKIRVGLGSASEMVGNTDMNLLAQKLSDSYGVEPVGSVTCKSSGSTAPLSFRENQWHFSPREITPTPGVSNIEFRIEHPNLPNPVFELASVATVLDSEPIQFIRVSGGEESPTRSYKVSADESWVENYGRIEFSRNWDGVSNGFKDIGKDPQYFGFNGGNGSTPDIPARYLVKAGDRIMPFCYRSAYGYGSMGIKIRKTLLPTDVSIFDLADDEYWQRFVEDIPRELLDRDHLFDETWWNFSKFIAVFTRDISAEVLEKFRSKCASKPCVICRAESDLALLKNHKAFLNRLRGIVVKSNGKDPSSEIPPGVRPIIATCVLLADLKGRNGYPTFMDWDSGKGSSEIILPRGGIFYTNTYGDEDFIPEDESLLSYTHLGWTSGFPLRMEFTSQIDNHKIVVNWVGLYTGLNTGMYT